MSQILNNLMSAAFTSLRDDTSDTPQAVTEQIWELPPPTPSTNSAGSLLHLPDCQEVSSVSPAMRVSAKERRICAGESFFQNSRGIFPL